MEPAPLPAPPAVLRPGDTGSLPLAPFSPLRHPRPAPGLAVGPFRLRPPAVRPSGAALLVEGEGTAMLPMLESYRGAAYAWRGVPSPGLALEAGLAGGAEPSANVACAAAGEGTALAAEDPAWG